jgi:hypothetical protein
LIRHAIPYQPAISFLEKIAASTWIITFSSDRKPEMAAEAI